MKTSTRTQTIKDFQKRGLLYWYEDGLSELAAGGLFLLYAAYSALVTATPPGFHVALNLGHLALVPLSAVGAAKLVKALKARVTAPRTGHVAFRRRRGVGLPALIIVGAISAAAVAGALLHENLHIPVVVTGLGIAAGLWIQAHKIGLRRLVVIGIVSAAAGCASAFAPVELTGAFAMLFAALGVAFAISGAVVLSSYLKMNRGRAE